MLTDLRLALRSLRNAPLFTLAAVTMLALGIGANTAIFSIVFGVLLRPLPFADPGRLVSVVRMRTDVPSLPDAVSAVAFDEWRATARSLTGLALYRTAKYTVTGHGFPEHVEAALVSGEFFATLGTRPAAGRVLAARDGEQAVAVLSPQFARRRFGESDAVGRTLRVNGQPYTVVGVMPRPFAYPSAETMLWLPRASIGDERAAARYPMYQMIGRLATDATIDRARAEAMALGRRIAPPHSGGARVVTEVRYLEDEMVGDVRKGLLVLLAIVGVVLLGCSVNVGSLCLARFASRRADSAVRAALGASRWRLIRLALSECVVVAAAGAAIGVLLATLALPFVLRVITPHMPRLAEVTIGLPVLAFTIAVSALTVLLAGLVPAWYASRLAPHDVLLAGAGSGGRHARGGRLRFALVTASTALSTLVLVAALLFARSLGTLLDVEAGRPAERVLTVALTLPAPAYADMYRDPGGSARAVAFVDDALDRARRIPGVQSAAVTTSLPPNLPETSFTWMTPDRATGKPQPYTVNFLIVGGDYFRAMGITCLRGRVFNDRDRAGAPMVIVVGRDLARRKLGRDDVVGERLEVLPRMQATIVGVVDDVRYTGLDRPAGGALYLPYAQAATANLYLVVRTAGSALAVVEQLRGAVRGADARVPIGQPRTLHELRHSSVAGPESRAVLLGWLAALALVLAVAGLYGNSSYVTSQRTFEVGVRLALGADAASVVRLLVGGGLVPVALGLAIGLASAAGVSRAFASLLFGVHPLDGVTFAAVPLLLLLVAAAAIALPALRAVRLNPALTLRRAA